MRFAHGILGFTLALIAVHTHAEVTELSSNQLEHAFIEGITSAKEKIVSQKVMEEEFTENTMTREKQKYELMATTKEEFLLRHELYRCHQAFANSFQPSILHRVRLMNLPIHFHSKPLAI